MAQRRKSKKPVTHKPTTLKDVYTDVYEEWDLIKLLRKGERPFSFGRSKARELLHALDTHGGNFVEFLREFCYPPVEAKDEPKAAPPITKK